MKKKHRVRQKSLQRTHSAALAAATSSVASALTSLQTAYADSLEKLVAADKNRRELAQSGLLEQITTAQNEKNLIDARVALEGTAASRDLVLQQKLATLQKELELTKAQQGAESQLKLAALKDRIAIRRSFLSRSATKCSPTLRRSMPSGRRVGGPPGFGSGDSCWGRSRLSSIAVGGEDGRDSNRGPVACNL